MIIYVQEMLLHTGYACSVETWITNHYLEAWINYRAPPTFCTTPKSRKSHGHSYSLTEQLLSWFLFQCFLAALVVVVETRLAVWLTLGFRKRRLCAQTEQKVSGWLPFWLQREEKSVSYLDVRWILRDDIHLGSKHVLAGNKILWGVVVEGWVM